MTFRDLKKGISKNKPGLETIKLLGEQATLQPKEVLDRHILY